ncbi:hypothetical protein NFI96_018624 [Prochilodus magdalenae]|nr:hypothetical protein NFI96_018624 [Prochilodus magdalenae]
MNYTIVPQNVTINSGKSATFRCGAAPFSGPERLNFTVQRPDANYSLSCPGDRVNIPSLLLNGQCEVKSSEIIATWEITNLVTKLSDTVFKCQIDGVGDKYAFLWVQGNGAYYAMLFGCVMGGFFGILIIFGLTYISLKRSERLQNCFKGRAEDDVMTVADHSNQY